VLPEALAAGFGWTSLVVESAGAGFCLDCHG